jgi:hypothetical protein
MRRFVADFKIYNISVTALAKKRLEDVYKIKEVGRLSFIESFVD